MKVLLSIVSDAGDTFRVRPSARWSHLLAAFEFVPGSVGSEKATASSITSHTISSDVSSMRAGLFAIAETSHASYSGFPNSFKKGPPRQQRTANTLGMVVKRPESLQFS